MIASTSLLWLITCQSSPFPIDFAGRPYKSAIRYTACTEISASCFFLVTIFAITITIIITLSYLLGLLCLTPLLRTVPPSSSHKCLRFGLWSTLRTLNDLLTYLLTYLNTYLQSPVFMHRRLHRAYSLNGAGIIVREYVCLLYTSPSPRD